jgi:Putative zinc- or iron-chelating domain
MLALSRRARSLVHILDYTIRFTVWAVHAPQGLRSRTGRILTWGKIRRSAIVCVPGLGARLQRRHGLAGGCTQCGASCNLLMRCPRWDPGTRLCRIYDSRPPVCRLFPMTPADLRDVALSGAQCGHRFDADVRPVRVYRG